MRTTTITIQGLAPLLMHNGQLADPLNEHAKALAKLTSKQKKTEADHLAVRKAEWYGGIYVDKDGHPCLPGEVLEACLVEGAKKFKLGKAAKGGIVVDGNFRIDYRGPKTVDGLWDDGGYIKIAGVKLNGKTRVIRARPMFPEWSCTFDVLWDDSLIKDEDTMMDIVQEAGAVGVGDYRPKFGRFEVVS